MVEREGLEISAQVIQLRMNHCIRQVVVAEGTGGLP